MSLLHQFKVALMQAGRLMHAISNHVAEDDAKLYCQHSQLILQLFLR